MIKYNNEDTYEPVSHRFRMRNHSRSCPFLPAIQPTQLQSVWQCNMPQILRVFVDSSFKVGHSMGQILLPSDNLT